MAPFDLIIELSRAEDGGDPFAFLFGEQIYHLRGEGGGTRAAKLTWDDALKEALLAAHATPRKEGAAAALGRKVGDLLRELRWPEAELAGALAEGRPVRWTIRSSAAELYSLPWELVSLDARGSRLGRSPGCLLRYEWPETTTAPRASKAEGGRILFAWSDAGGHVPSEAHRGAIESACKGRLAFDPERDILGDRAALTWESLAAALEQATAEGRPYSILHVLCHGAPLDGDDSAHGLVWGRATAQEVLSGQTLGEMLGPHAGGLRLIVLGACQGGDSAAPGSPLGGVAQGLHRAGIEAVIASRFPLSKEGSVLFAAAFYESLLGEPASVETAFLTARSALAKKPTLGDDVSLQLYARAADGADTRPVAVRPYRGLEAFRESDQRFFFGRDEEINETVRDLVSLVDSALPRFLVVAGASGTGKSSMVFAGAVPALKKQSWVVLPSIRPGADPLSELAKLRARLAEELARWERLAPEQRPAPGAARILLIIDQLEELFTHADPRDRAARDRRDTFIRELWGLAAAPAPRVAVLATMRVDFLGRAGEIVLDKETGLRFDKGVVYRDEYRVLLAQMGREQLRRAILCPAEKVGLSLQPGLADRMLSDVGGEPGALPLLQFTLDRLWQEREGRELTQAAYDRLGGLAGAVTSTAERTFNELDADARKVARRLFVRLVSVRDDAALDTRRRVALEDLRPGGDEAALFNDVLRRFTEARLLVCDDVLIDQQSMPMVEVAHEALIRSWGTLRGWVNEQRKMLSDVDRLRGWAAERKKDERFLLMGSLLDRARGMLAAYPEDIARDPSLAAARALIDESIAAAEREQNEREAQRQRELAQARRAREFALMAAARELLAQGAPWWAMVILSESEEPGLARGWEQMAQDLLTTPWLPTTMLRGHQDALTHVAFSPDGGRLVTTSLDRTAMLFSADGTGEPVSWKGHDNAVMWAEFSPDGQFIVTASGDMTARIWRADGAGEPVILRGHTGPVLCAAFSPDGRFIVTASVDGTARRWNADGTGEPTIFAGHGGQVNTATFSPDGTRIVTASADRTARIWSADGGAGELIVLGGHEDAVIAAAFTPDGKSVVTASYDRRARLWPADGKGEATVLGEHEAPIACAAAGPDGQTFATGAADGVVKLWTIGQDAPLILQPDFPAEVQSVAFSPDGCRLAVALHHRRIGEMVPYEPSVWVWSVMDGGGVYAIMEDGDPPRLIAASPDGARFLTVSEAQRIHLWSADMTEPPMALDGPVGEVTFAGFTPDGGRVLIGAGGGTAMLLSIDEPADVIDIAGHEAAIRTAAFSPDGRLMVTGDDSGAVRVGSADGTGEARLFKRHEAPVSGAAFSRDGLRVTTVAEDIRVWNVDGTGEPAVYPLDASTETVVDAISPGGEHVFMRVGGSACVRRTDGAGEPVYPPTGGALFAAFTPDGRRVLTGADTGTVMLSDVTGAADSILLSRDGSVVLSVATSLDGRWGVVLDDSGVARRWAISGEALRAQLREAVPLCLPQYMRMMYLGETQEEAERRFGECERSMGRLPRPPG